MRNIIIAILLLTAFTAQSQTKWRQIERSLTKWNVPAAYDSIPGQAGYAGKWIELTALLDSLGIDSIGGGGGIKGTGAANKVAYWKSADSLSFNNNFHWDNSNVRLGIGLTSPNYTIHSNGAIGTNSDFYLINPSYSNSGLRIQNYPGNIAGYGVGVIKGTNSSIWSSANDGLLFRNDIKRMVAQSDLLVTENFGTGKAWLGGSDIAGTVDVVIVDASPGSAEVTAMKYASTGYPPLHLRGHEINFHTNSTPNWPTFATVNSADIAATIKGDKKMGLSTTSPTRTLDINGELRVRDLTTDDPTQLIGADADGDISGITLGSGLTFTGSTLNISSFIDSTNVIAGYGIDVTESPLNTFTVKADTAEVATQYDLTLLGTVKSIATSAPISGGTITSSGTIGLNYDSNTLTLSGSNLIARNGSAIWNADKLQNTTIKSVLSPSIGNVLTYTASNQWEAQAPPAGTTNLTFSGSASPFTLNSDTGTDVTIAAGDNVTLSRSSNQLTISSTVPVVETWADIAGDVISWGSTGTFNSGKQVGIGTLNAARLLDVNGDAQLRGAIYSSTSSAGSSGQVLTSGGTGAWTWATPADGSATNELQTLSHTSDATTHTTTLSNSGGSLILAEGSGITLTTSSNQVTIAASGTSTDLTFTGSASPYTLNSSTGTDVTFAEGNNITLQRLSNQLVINAVVNQGYAQIHRTSDFTDVSFGATEEKVDFTAGLSSSNMTNDPTNDRVTVGITGTRGLKITYSGSFTLNDTSKVDFIVYKNGASLGYVSEQEIRNDDTGPNNATVFSKSFITTATNNDYFELYYVRRQGSATTISLKNVVLNIEVVF